MPNPFKVVNNQIKFCEENIKPQVERKETRKLYSENDIMRKYCREPQ
jgi:hypothetical protein